MDKQHYDELIENLKVYSADGLLDGNSVLLFGHCEATLTLADELLKLGVTPKAILDNSDVKKGIIYRDIPVAKPEDIIDSTSDQSVVLIATRFYEAMRSQLINLGFKGRILKAVDYNTYAEYSFSEDTIRGKRERTDKGLELINDLKEKYPDSYIFFCPFAALGDIYFCMSYLPLFMKKRDIGRAVVCVVGNACKKVAKLFNITDVEVESFPQKDLDSMVQASLAHGIRESFIAHQDRPYVVNLHKALQYECIPLEMIYRCGIFGLDKSAAPVTPDNWKDYQDIQSIPQGKAVIISPYAKSVTSLPESLWDKIINKFCSSGYQVYTNVSGNEMPLEGTLPISPDISEMKSVVERAGTFIGIRSGMCDVLRTAKGRKIALFPDYNYGNTKWKAIDMYRLEEFENFVYTGNDEEILEKL